MSFENAAVGHAIGYPGYQAANVPLGSVVLNGPSNFLLGTPGVVDPVFGRFNIFSTPQGEIVDFYASTIGVNTVTLLPGNPGGGFGSPISIPMGTSSPVSFIFPHLDETSPFPTLIGVNLNAQLQWRQGTGPRTYGPLNTLSISPTGIASEDIVAGQFNPAIDNHTDVAVTVTGFTAASHQVVIFFGDGSGSFPTRTTLPVGLSPFGLASGDLNGDGIDDLVVAIGGGNVISVFLTVGDGTFQFVNDFPVGNFPRFVKLGKVNNDPFLDAVTANNDGTVSVLLGLGNGSFAPQTLYTVSTSTLAVALGDFRNIGVVDAITTNNIARELIVLLNDGNGAFPTQVHLPVSGASDPSGVTVAEKADGEIFIGATVRSSAEAVIYTIAAPTPSPSPSPSVSATLTPSIAISNPSSSQSVTISLSSAAVAASSEAARKPDNPDPKPDATKKPQPTRKETRKPTKTKKATASRSRPQSEVSGAASNMPNILRNAEYLPSSLMLLAAGAKMLSSVRNTVSQWASSFFQEKLMQEDEPIITSHQKMHEVFEMPLPTFPRSDEANRPQPCADSGDEGFCVLDTQAFDHVQRPFFTSTSSASPENKKIAPIFLFAHVVENHHRATDDVQAPRLGVK